jgi:hypothetical protein
MSESMKEKAFRCIKIEGLSDKLQKNLGFYYTTTTNNFRLLLFSDKIDWVVFFYCNSGLFIINCRFFLGNKNLNTKLVLRFILFVIL